MLTFQDDSTLEPLFEWNKYITEDFKWQATTEFYDTEFCVSVFFKLKYSAHTENYTYSVWIDTLLL